ncbi:unnamed protein product [Caenorhabditis brenneri]
MAQRFPLIRLPFLCIQDIVNFWGEYELLYFSLISRRTKYISKSIKRRLKALEVYIKSDNLLVLDYGNFGRPFFSPSNSGDRLMDELLSQRAYIRVLPSLPDLLEATKQFSEIFEAQSRTITLELGSFMREAELNKIIDTLNSFQGKIEEFRINLNYGSVELFKILMKRLSIHVASFTVFSQFNFFALQLFVDPLHFKCDVFEAPRITQIISVESLLGTDCKELYLEEQCRNSEQSNQVLKSWMEGKWNEELKRCTIKSSSTICIKIDLNEWEAELRDPRTSLESFQVTIHGEKLETIQVRGGIVLTRHDGKRILISFLGLSEYLNTEVTQKMIRQYEDMTKCWKTGEVRIETRDWGGYLTWRDTLTYFNLLVL